MIEFLKGRRGIVFFYEPENVDGRWAWQRLKTDGQVRISRTFRFRRTDLLDEPSDEEFERDEPFVFRFRFARRSDGYNRIEGRILGSDTDVFLAEEIELLRKLFVAPRDISIFRRVSKAVGPGVEIVVGGRRANAIPYDAFLRLISRFPGTAELDRYANARIEDIIGEFVDGMRDARANYEAYLNRQGTIVAADRLDQSALFTMEIEKYLFIRNTIADWLSSHPHRSERDWQTMLAQFLLLIFPKYVALLSSVSIVDSYTRKGATTRRQIDLALVDAGGNLDVIEIKRPDCGSLLARAPYRSNGVPAKELTGSIMQAEKYLFHLSKWGVLGERELTHRYSRQLPAGMEIRITNPKAILILGRNDQPQDESDGSARALDLEVIKRKYANVIDILTYDDLLRRLDNVIASLRMRATRDAAIETPP